MTVRNYIRENPAKYVCGLFMYIKGAFDHAWWPAIIKRFRDTGCPSSLMAVVQDYFRQRRTYITGNTFAVSREAKRGCSQGSVLGPTFWNIIMDTFLNITYAFNILSVAYADDGVVIFAGNSRRELAARATIIGDELTAWAEQYKLTIYGNKTHTMMLKGRFKPGRQPLRMHIHGHRIKLVRTTTYLGLCIDEGFFTYRHVLDTAAAARDCMHGLR